MDLQNIFKRSGNGEIKCRKVFHSESLDRPSLYVPTEVLLSNLPQVQNRCSNCDGEADLNRRRSPRLSGKNGETNTQKKIEMTEKEIKYQTKDHIRVPHLNWPSLSKLKTEAEMSSMPLIQNRTADYGGHMNLQNIRRSPRFAMNDSGEMYLHSFFDCSGKGTKCRKESQRESLDRHYLSVPNEVQFPSMPQVQNTGADCVINTALQNIRKSPRLSFNNREINLQSLSACSKEGITYQVESHRKGSQLNNLSFPTKVLLANMPKVENQSADYGQFESKNLRNSPRFVGSKNENYLKKIFECNEKRIKCKPESQREGSDRNVLSSPNKIDLVNTSQLVNTSANYDRQMDFRNKRKSPRLSGRIREMDLKNITEYSEQDIKCRPEFQTRASEGNRTSPSEVVVDYRPQFESGNTNSDEEMNLLRLRKSPRFSDRNKELHLKKMPESSESGINCMLQSQKKHCERNIPLCQLEVKLIDFSQGESGSPDCGVCLVENARASSQTSFKSVPSFEYYVSSGKGINLIVDLDSSPSDWTKKRFENDIQCNGQNLMMKQFQSFRQEIECLGSNKMKGSLISNTDSVNKIGHVENETSSRCVDGRHHHLHSVSPDGDNRYLDIGESESCSVAGIDGGIFDNLCKGDENFTFAEELEGGIPITETKASDSILEERSEDCLSDGSQRRKRQGREIRGALLRSGLCLGARRSTRLFYQHALTGTASHTNSSLLPCTRLMFQLVDVVKRPL